MENFQQHQQLVPITPLEILGEKSICKIDISGFSLDNYKTFNPEGYTILCNVGKTCDGLTFFPTTSTVVLDSQQQSKLLYNFEQLIPNIADELNISQEAALEKTYNFLSNSVIRVEPKGIQGATYKIMKNLQNYLPISTTVEAVSFLKTTGMSGLSIVSNAPLVFVSATYIGSIFFGYAGSVAGENAIGVLFNGTSFLLSRPMRGVEVILNGLILTPLSNTLGLPLILNGTQEILSGKGVSMTEYTKIALAFERISNSTIVKKAKRIYDVIRNND